MGRAPCCDKNGLKKGPWTPEEDLILSQYIQEHGPGNWRNLPKNAGLKRCGKSCRLRWTNYLRPDIKRGRFSFEEEEAIIQLHSVLGNKWSAIAARLPGRTDNEIKNYWNTHIRKRLLKMGIDPVTHGPRLDLLELSSVLGGHSPSDLNNLSSLLGLQTAPAFNPDLYLRLATAILSLKQQNPEMLLRKVQENQLILNSQLENQLLKSLLFQQNQFSQSSDQAIIGQEPNVQNFSSNQRQPFQGDSMINTTSWNNENVMSEDSIFQFVDNGNQNFGFDSVLSTPLSSSPITTPLNSSNALGYSTAEDERESYCSDLLTKFEIPESLDISEFL